MRSFQWPSQDVSRTNLCQRGLATLCPARGFQEVPDGLVLPHVLWWTDNHFFLNRCMEGCHRHTPQAEATAMTTRCSSRQNETHCCKWWCGRQHVFALACTSDLIDHQSRPHQSSSSVPDSLASLTSSFTSNSNMRFTSVSRPAFTCSSSSISPV